jgi:hypothetical protein
MSEDAGSAAATHWDAAYSHGDTTRSWYQSDAALSLELISRYAEPAGSVVDVGGGASTLVDGLLATRHDDITVTDVSPAGLATAQQRLRASADTVRWLEQDVRTWQPHRTFDVWHDRAVLHFMVEGADQAAYHRALVQGTHSGSVVIIAGFGPAGPSACSGLPTVRRDAAGLATFLGGAFRVRHEQLTDHVTPAGAVQQFQWVVASRE